MQGRSTILNELKDISPLVAGINPENTYQVPQGYFEGLAGSILARIKASQPSAKEELETISPLLNSLSRKLPYEVPQDYFGELSETVVGGVRAIDFVKGELQHISPLMDSLKHKNVYQIPEGYFDNLAGNILDKIKSRQPAKVVSMGHKVMRYAVAAAIVGVMAIGGWMYFNNAAPTEQPLAAIEKLSDDSGVSEQEMSNYLENETLTVAISTPIETEEDMDAADVKEMLSDVSEDELQQYLTTL